MDPSAALAQEGRHPLDLVGIGGRGGEYQLVAAEIFGITVPVDPMEDPVEGQESGEIGEVCGQSLLAGTRL